MAGTQRTPALRRRRRTGKRKTSDVRGVLTPGPYVECAICGFEADDPIALPRHRCPKCHANAWRRRFRPGWLRKPLLNEDRSNPPP